jgi:hypothetical protein
MPDNDTPAGATPVVAGATPVQTPAPAPTGEEPLGAAGLRALQEERKRADAAEKAAKAATEELDKLRTAGQSEQEKAIAKARREGAEEVLAKAQSQVRVSEVRTALLAAGLQPGLLGYVAKGDEFANLKVTEDGDVVGLDEAVKALKQGNPALFATTPQPNGGKPDFGGGPRGGAATADADMNTLIRQAAGRR